MRARLTKAQIQKRLQDYSNYKHLYGDAQKKCGELKENRKTAKARNNYQTSKTERGARRRSVLASVLTTLRQNLSEFSMETVVAEVRQWRISGQSLFDQQLQAAQARASPT